MNRPQGEPVVAVRYGDWSPDRRGWLFGVSGRTVTAVLLAGVPALLATGLHRWTVVLGWLPIWGLLTVALCVPVAGRPAGRWALDAVLSAVGAAAGWSAWQSRAASGQAADTSQADLPGVLAGIRTHDGPPLGPALSRPAIVQDRAAGSWAVVARVSHPGIALVEAAGRARMAAGLSELLEGAATAELVSVLTLQVRTVPDDGAQRTAWQASNNRADAPDLAVAVEAELGQALVQAGVRHEAFVTVVVDQARIRRQARHSGRGLEASARALYSVLGEVESRLLGATGCTGVSWLDSSELAAVIRTGFAPGDAAALTSPQSQPGGPRSGGLPLSAAGPTRAPSPGRRHYVHDAWSSATCTVLLPEQGALMGALAPILTPSAAGERRCMTVFFQPLGRQHADRLVGREAMSAGTAAELRTRMGFQTRASHRRDNARVHDADTRLAAGRSLVRVAVAAAVTVPSDWGIAEHSERLESSVRGAGFTPLRLDLAQDSGFAAACIPLGIGLPRRRDNR